MDAKQIAKITQFVADNIGDFHQKRLDNIKSRKLNTLLKRCNPYLLKAKNLELASDFIKELFSVSLTHGEQTIFGEFLEDLAIFVGQEIYGAKKSGITGMDLEFERDEVQYIVSIKSGPNWGNSSAVIKQKELFVKAARTIRQNKRVKNVRPVLGCCFGKRATIDRGEYDHYCGQQFWEFLSGDKKLYIDIIKPLGHQAKQRNEKFQNEYNRFFNLLLKDFMERFCADGKINWEALVKLNSEHKDQQKKN